MIRVILGVALAAIFFQGVSRAEDAQPPAGCTESSKRVECVLYYGSKAGPGSGTGTVTGVQPVEPDKSLQRFVVFIHASGGNSDLVDRVTKALAARRYNVKGADDQGIVGGAAIDYFRDEDREGAEAIRSIVNGVLPEGSAKVEVRKQAITNPPGYIGVWLSSPGIQGWYYLGKLEKDKKNWTSDSSAGGKDLTFLPPVESGKDIPAQIKSAMESGKAIAFASGSKYLRALDAQPGKKASAAVVSTHGPQVKVRIVELDESGKDNDYPVLWGKILVLN